MTVIHVDFKDREFWAVKKEVETKLEDWGLEPQKLVPNDAIACALDEVRFYENFDDRLDVLKKLEGVIKSF